MYKTKKKFPYLWAHVFLIFVALGMIIPFIWMVLTSFKTMTEST
ncbi:carbohydrate ABC transporter permease, partial [Streptococcus agalactiae]